MTKQAVWLHQIIDGLVALQREAPDAVGELVALIPDDQLARSRAYMSGYRDGVAVAVANAVAGTAKDGEAITDRFIQEALYDKRIHVGPEVDRDDRHYGECNACNWRTTGEENTVEDAAYDHVADVHLPDVRHLEPAIRENAIRENDRNWCDIMNAAGVRPDGEPFNQATLAALRAQERKKAVAEIVAHITAAQANPNYHHEELALVVEAALLATGGLQ